MNNTVEIKQIYHKNKENISLGTKISNKIIESICEVINERQDNLSVLELLNFGNKILDEEMKEYPVNISIGFPLSICLNNCLGNKIYDKDDTIENTLIKKEDVIKIELGINANGCISINSKTVVYKSDKYDKYLKILNKLEKEIKKHLISGELNHDIKTLVESYCIDNDCFPVENNFSYEQKPNHQFIRTSESKYIVFNHKKYYNDEEMIIEPDDCFMFETGEIYNINLKIIPMEDRTQIFKYVENDNSHIYNLNEYYYSLKLNSSKEFYKLLKRTHNNDAFFIGKYLNNAKNKMGFREMKENGILDEYTIQYIKQKDNQKTIPVFQKGFTVLVNYY